MTNYAFFDYATHVNGHAKDFSLFGNFHCIDRRTNAQKIWNRYAGCLVLEGTGTYKDWHGNTHPVRPGTFVHHHPRKFHDIKRPPEGWVEHTIGFDENLYDHLVALGLLDTDSPVIQIPNPSALIAQLEEVHAAVSKPNHNHASIMNLIIQVMLELERQTKSNQARDDKLESARQALAQDFTCELDLQILAKNCNMGYTHFRTQFKKRFELSPSAYRKAQRMHQAKLRLEATPLSMADLAEELGYNDQFAFSKEFKRCFGISPKRYNLEHAPD